MLISSKFKLFGDFSRKPSKFKYFQSCAKRCIVTDQQDYKEMSHSTKGEEFLFLAQILVYFSLVQISCFWKFVLIKVFDYLTFAKQVFIYLSK